MESNRIFLDELLVNIFGNLNVTDLTAISTVCKQWNRVSKSPGLWRKLVLLQWPTQRFLYKRASTSSLRWRKVYMDLCMKSWYSPDNMKYFISCKTVEDELVSAELRKAMFEKMSVVSQKWLHVYPYESDNSTSQSFDKNAELYYDISQLKWTFLDRRRGYMGELFPSHKLRAIKRNKKIRHIRTYQVIPSCLVLYRWLCLFRAYATAEDGLTFYRIWRFRLKHLETGKIFEIYDWKAAMNTTFSNGEPTDSIYCNDALELLDVLSHQHFIMHPFGYSTSLSSNASKYLACACAGGIPRPQDHPKKREHRKRKIGVDSASCQNILVMDRTSDRVKSPIEIADSDDAESRSVKNKYQCNVLSPLASPIARNTSSQSFTYDRQCFSRQSSCSSIFSDTEDSERSEKESDVESECEAVETGYTSNCEYFIVTTHSFDIEEQHSIQASVSDGWLVTHKPMPNSCAVLFNSTDGFWYLPTYAASNNSHRKVSLQTSRLNHSRSSSDVSMQSQSDSNVDVSKDNLPIKRCFTGHNIFPSKIKDANKNRQSSNPNLSQPGTSSSLQSKDRAESCLLLSSESLKSATNASSASTTETAFGLEHKYEAIPSCLALYRLICLFDLNCSMYRGTNDSSVWSVKMLHKKTGGIMQLQDYNGWFQVHVSSEMPCHVTQNDSAGESADDDETTTTTTESSIGTARDLAFNASEFKAAVLQVLNLLVDDRFSHPYGTVAGSVA
eukprot:gene16716-18410_t